MHAMPVMIIVLCAMAIAYRYYSAFLAAKVAVLDDHRITPAFKFEDGQNYEPTNKWVLFGHHFAAISGAGPLIGPVLAAQFGYLPGLLWIVIGVCLAGAVQDFLVLGMSLRRDGKSLAQIAFNDIGKIAGAAAMIAILFILVIALAGLGKVVVKALGGETVAIPPRSILQITTDASVRPLTPMDFGVSFNTDGSDHIPAGSDQLAFSDDQTSTLYFEEAHGPFRHVMHYSGPIDVRAGQGYPWVWDVSSVSKNGKTQWVASASFPPRAEQVIRGSSWGTFTIACTIPIALFVGFYIYKIRKGRVIEASLIGGALTIGATILGGWISQHSIGSRFNLTQDQVLWAMAIYGFIAAVLPVWVLLVPRDYLSSFLKIGTIAILVGGVIIANPKLEAPAINSVFSGGGPAVPGKIFPFLFITIMCGAISGFHALVSSGTTPKMIRKERDARMIGYGAMLMEGLVGVVAMIAAATLPVGSYYAMNTDLAVMPKFHDRILMIPGGEIEHVGDYESLTQESLRGRTGGGVTLAVGMAQVFDSFLKRFSNGADWLWKYWYHFAIMFEALFILTTIDAGTRIGRFLLQEILGKAVHPKFAETTWWPGTLLSTFLIVAGWAYFINSDSFAAIWAMFGVANQMLAVIALAVVSVYLVNEGRAKYLWVSLCPMLVVMTTTSTAAVQILIGKMDGIHVQLAKAARTAAEQRLLTNSIITAALLVAMLACTLVILIAAGVRIAAAPADKPRNNLKNVVQIGSESV